MKTVKVIKIWEIDQVAETKAQIKECGELIEYDSVLKGIWVDELERLQSKLSQLTE